MNDSVDSDFSGRVFSGSDSSGRDSSRGDVPGGDAADRNRADDAGGTGGTAPPFATIGILGLGLIGGSLAMAIRARHPSVTIVGVDRADVLREAQRRGLIDRATSDVVTLGKSELGEGDLLVLAAPVLQNLACLEQLVAAAAFDAELGRGDRGVLNAGLPGIKPLVTDVGSTKRVIVDAARARPGALAFIGGHPMAGAAQGGLDHARADLFDGKPWLLTPTADTLGGPPLARLTALVQSIGAESRVLPAAEHDRVMAYVSHLPQMMSSALMRTVGERVGAEALQLSGPGLADTTRLASSPSAVWTDICETNADLIDAALDAVQAEIDQARQHLRKPADLAAWLAEGQHWRTKMPPRAV